MDDFPELERLAPVVDDGAAKKLFATRRQRARRRRMAGRVAGGLGLLITVAGGVAVWESTRDSTDDHRWTVFVDQPTPSSEVPANTLPEDPPAAEIPAGWTTEVLGLAPEILLLATTGPAPEPLNQDRCPGALLAAVGAGGSDVVVVAVHAIDGTLGLGPRSAQTEQLKTVDVTEQDVFGCVATGSITQSTRFIDNGRAVMLSLVAGPEADAARVAEGRQILLGQPIEAAEQPPLVLPDERWRTLAPAPIEPRHRAASTWTGEELLIWGGGGPHVTSPITSDAVGLQGGEGFYVPIAESWATDGAAYDPAADTWRVLPPSPLRPGVGWGLEDVWTGDEWLVFSHGIEQGVAYDPVDDSWRVLTPAPVPPGYLGWVPVVVWAGDRVLFVGGADHGQDVPMLTMAYDPRADTWTELPAAPITGRQSHAAAWTGEELVVWGGTDWGSVGESDAGAAYDPASDSWRLLASYDSEALVLPPAAEVRTPAVWTGTEMVVPSRPTLVFDPAADRWREIDQPVGGSGQYGRVQLLGDRLLLWADSTPTLIETDGSVVEDLPARLLGDRCHAVGEWTGTELLVWGAPSCADQPPADVGFAFAP